jgi:hypothetical protein
MTSSGRPRTSVDVKRRIVQPAATSRFWRLRSLTNTRRSRCTFPSNSTSTFLPGHAKSACPRKRPAGDRTTNWMSGIGTPASWSSHRRTDSIGDPARRSATGKTARARAAPRPDGRWANCSCRLFSEQPAARSWSVTASSAGGCSRAARSRHVRSRTVRAKDPSRVTSRSASGRRCTRRSARLSARDVPGTMRSTRLSPAGCIGIWTPQRVAAVAWLSTAPTGAVNSTAARRWRRSPESALGR